MNPWRPTNLSTTMTLRRAASAVEHHHDFCCAQDSEGLRWRDVPINDDVVKFIIADFEMRFFVYAHKYPVLSRKSVVANLPLTCTRLVTKLSGRSR